MTPPTPKPPGVLIISGSAFLRKRLARDLLPNGTSFGEAVDADDALQLETFSGFKAVVVAQVDGLPDAVELQTLVAVAPCPVFLWSPSGTEVEPNLPQQITVLDTQTLASQGAANPLHAALLPKRRPRLAEDHLAPSRHSFLRSEELVEHAGERLGELRRCLRRRDAKSARLVLTLIAADLAEVWSLTH
ncbi:MAG: hypothetical protein AAGA78_07920 [Pseudomonadota bacterium]